MTVTTTTDRALIYQTLIDWLSASTGISSDTNIVWLNQVVERPAKPYIGMLFVSRGIKTGTDDVIQTFDVPSQNVQRLTAGPRRMTLQIEIYTDPATSANDTEADEILENALLQLETEAIRETFRAAKIGILSVGSINRLDEILGERWERRAQAEIVVTYSGETFDDGVTSGNWIETVEVPTEENGNLIIRE